MHGHCAGGESRWSSGRAGRLRGAFRRGQRPRKKTELSIPMHGDDQSSCFQGLAGWHFLLAVPIVSPSLCAKRFSNLASPLQVIVQDSVNGAPSGASAQLRWKHHGSSDLLIAAPYLLTGKGAKIGQLELGKGGLRCHEIPCKTKGSKWPIHDSCVW